MATTNLIVDFLVIGLVSLMWISPIIAIVLDVEQIKDLLTINPLAIPIILGFVYIIGISVNRFADDITDHWNDKWRDEIFGKNSKPTYHNQLNLVIAKSESASEYLSYRRSVVRTARACAINFLFGSVLWLTLPLFKPNLIACNIILVISITATILSAFLFRSWKIVLRGYFYGIKDLYAALNNSCSLDKNTEMVDENANNK